MNLPKYDASGNAITYKAVETEVKLGDSTLTGATLIKTVYGNEDGTVTSTAETISTQTITNTVQSTSYKVKKTWGNGQTAPEGAEIKITLSGTIPAVAPATEPRPVTLSDLGVSPLTVTLDGVTEKDTVETTAWEYAWTNLPKYDNHGNEITYSAAETTYKIGTETIDISGTMAPTYTSDAYQRIVTNKLPTRDIVVEKVWSPDGWPKDIASVTVGLYQSVNGETATAVTSGDPATNVTITFNETSTGAQRTFANLPVYNASGNPITYSVKEISVIPVNGNAVAVTDGAVIVNGETWTVTNGLVNNETGIAQVTNNRNVISINVTKQWTNLNSSCSIPPQSPP